MAKRKTNTETEPLIEIGELVPVEEAVAPKKPRTARMVVQRVKVLSQAARRRMVQALITRISERLEQDGDGTKASVADLLKLLQLEKELAPPKREQKLVVQWVDPEQVEE